VKVISNDSYIERRSKIGRYTSLAALAVLGIGMFISIAQPRLMMWAFGSLLIGLLLSMVGIYYGNRFARVDRPDVVLTKALKGLDDRYFLYHYRAPTAHLLVGPDACLVLSVQLQTGKVSARGKRWKQSLGWKWLFAWMGQENIGNPAKTAQIEVDAVARFLQKQLPGVDVPLTPVVVFTDPKAELDVAETPVSVVHVKQLKDWLRSADASKAGKLSSSARKAVLDLFGRDESSSSES
jgi:hypothetical protein